MAKDNVTLITLSDLMDNNIYKVDQNGHQFIGLFKIGPIFQQRFVNCLTANE